MKPTPPSPSLSGASLREDESGTYGDADALESALTLSLIVAAALLLVEFARFLFALPSPPALFLEAAIVFAACARAARSESRAPVQGAFRVALFAAYAHELCVVVAHLTLIGVFSPFITREITRDLLLILGVGALAGLLERLRRATGGGGTASP